MAAELTQLKNQREVDVLKFLTGYVASNCERFLKVARENPDSFIKIIFFTEQEWTRTVNGERPKEVRVISFSDVPRVKLLTEEFQQFDYTKKDWDPHRVILFVVKIYTKTDGHSAAYFHLLDIQGVKDDYLNSLKTNK